MTINENINVFKKIDMLIVFIFFKEIFQMFSNTSKLIIL